MKHKAAGQQRNHRTGRLACLFAALAMAASPAATQRGPHGDDEHGHRGPSPSAAGAPTTPPWLDDDFPTTYAPPPHADLLIRHATILDGAGARIDDGDLLLQANKVAAIGRGLANPGNVREIDAHGRWLTPGVIDDHTHDGTYVVPLTSIDREAGDVAELSDLNDADILIQTAVNSQDLGFDKALRGGVTTLQILPGSSPIFGGRAVTVHPIPAATVQAMKFPGAPTGFKMACGENPKQQGADSHRGPTSREGEIAYIRKAFFDAQDYLREWRDYQAGNHPPPRRDLKREGLAGLLTGEYRLNIHCYRADDMANMIAVAREFGVKIAAFHHAVEAYKIPDQLRASGICAAVWGDWWGFKMEALDAVRPNAALLDLAGVCVTMHSDSPLVGQRLNLEAAKAAGAARKIGIVIPPERMIRWITSNPAHVLGLDDRIGTLAPGYDADVVLWSGDPFSVYTHADLVLIDGAIAFDRSAPPDRPASDFQVGRRAMEAK